MMTRTAKLMSHEGTTAELRSELEHDLTAAIGASTVAYVNFPNIGNLGDSVIYSGAREALRRIGTDVALAVEPAAYRRRLVLNAVGARGTILIHGGANFGDIYRTQPQQTVRSRILRDFPDARVIQLPQTIYFRDPSSSTEFLDRCRAHRDLTIMVRDRLSIDRLEALGLEATLVPDLAFGLGPLGRPPASGDLAWILREDVERSFEPGSLDRSAQDWPSGADQRAGETGSILGWDLALVRGLNRAREHAPQRLRRPIHGLAQSRYGAIARRRVELARALVAAGEVLITDRLHAHILACLMGIPNVVLDNSYGKNRGLFDAWTNRYATARFADGPEQARELAGELLRSRNR